MSEKKTASGFCFEFERERMDDMRVIELLSEVTDGEAADFDRLRSAGKLIELLLGKEQKKNLYEHIGQSYNGRVPYSALEMELFEIMNSAGQDAAKN